MKKKLGKDPLSWIGNSESIQENKEDEKVTLAPSKSKIKKSIKRTSTKEPTIETSTLHPTLSDANLPTLSSNELTINENESLHDASFRVDRELPAFLPETKDFQDSQKKDQTKSQWVSFRLNREYYAIHIRYIKEIITDTPLTQMPDTVDYIAGMATVRQQMFPVIHLKKFFKMNDVSIPEHYSIILVESNLGIDGFLVDEMRDVITMEEKDILPVPETVNGQREKAITGVIRCDQGLVSVIDPLTIIHFTQNQIQEQDTMQDTTKSAESQISAKRTEATAEQTIQFVSFFIETDEFAVDIKNVQEIIKMINIAHVPRAPKFVEGVINLRGSIVPVLNLRERFGIQKIPYNRNTRIIVVNIASKQVGLIVDSVSEVIRIQLSAIKDPPTEAIYHDTGLVKGMAEINGRIVIIVDLEGILNDQETKHLQEFHDIQN